jgi:tRNA dimethylallyltransferase
MDDLPSSNPENIQQLEKEFERNGVEALFKKLQKADPEYANEVDRSNHRRIIRALDVWMQTGKPFSGFHTQSGFSKPEHLSVFALRWPRKMLHRRIEQRCNEMIENGLVEETRQILKAGFSPGLQALQTVGYKQVLQYLDGEISREQMIKDFKTATRRYAKRQITWLRRWPFVNWINCPELNEPEILETIQHQVAADVNKG